MIVLTLGKSALEKFEAALRDARHQEIGGVLAGEHIADNVFEVVDFSVQKNGGTSVCFTRTTKTHQKFLKSFFDKTGHDYQRYNYLGEWHSHPSFPAIPSGTDLSQMAAIAQDPTQSGQFVILIIVRLDSRSRLQLHASAHMRDGSVQNVLMQHCHNNTMLTEIGTGRDEGV